MDAFKQARLRAIEEYEKKLGCFAPIPDKMRRIEDHADLEKLRSAGLGFIINIRGEHAKVHRINCDIVEIMGTSKFAKIFSIEGAGVIIWLSARPEGTWDHCGSCGGARG